MKALSNKRYRLLKKFMCATRWSLYSIILISTTIVYPNYFESTASYQVYFTPGQDCARQIVNTIEKAKESIYVQAYFLTSEPILAALLNAKARQVDVKIILDKNHPEHQKSIQRMHGFKIPIWIDHTSGIAHNKVMIIDHKRVITGSFNFTYSANHRNRENVLIIEDRGLARSYLENWKRCQQKSIPEVSGKKRPNSKNTVKQQHQSIKIRYLVLMACGMGLFLWQYS